MSKKKIDLEMREIAERIKEMTKYWDEDDSDDEAETENENSHCCDGDCKNCIYWDNDEHCCAFDNKTEEEDEEEEDEEEQYYRYPECECVDGECDQCDHWINTDYCELDDIYENCEGHEICGCSDEDCYSCKGSKENTQIEELSKFITSVNTVLGGDMGLLVFDKSNKKDMEKLAAIFKEYAKQLS